MKAARKSPKRLKRKKILVPLLGLGVAVTSYSPVQAAVSGVFDTATQDEAKSVNRYSLEMLLRVYYWYGFPYFFYGNGGSPVYYGDAGDYAGTGGYSFGYFGGYSGGFFGGSGGGSGGGGGGGGSGGF
jgi:hypothetical protein